MTRLSEAGEVAKSFIINGEWTQQPTQIVFYADNTTAISHIYKGTPGKAQAQSLSFRKHINDILNEVKEALIAISWVPGHAGIARNEKADHLAGDRAKMRLNRRDLLMQAFVASQHKKEMLEAWIHRWSNRPNTPNSGFHAANTLTPMLTPTKHFIDLDHKTFSHLIQFRTGHAHIGEYYMRFIRTEDPMCGCSRMTQTRLHILRDCPKYTTH